MANEPISKGTKVICYFCNRYIIENEDGHLFYQLDTGIVRHCHKECYEMNVEVAA